MVPSRKRASSTSHDIAASEEQNPNQFLETSSSMATDERSDQSECSSPENDSEISTEQWAGSTKYLQVKDEPEEINIDCVPDPELERDSFTPTSQMIPIEGVKDEGSIQENNDHPNVTKEMEFKKSTCFCGKSYSCNSHLNRHKKKTHGIIVRSTTSTERKNVEQQTENRRFLCCHCGRSYTKKANLKRHKILCAPEDTSGDIKDDSVTSHIEDQEPELLKPYICACGKGYTCSSHLYRHQKTHQEDQGFLEKRYMCECGKSYSCSSHLHRHQKSHMELKVLEVEQKDIKEEEPENLELETKIKPYLCFCGKSYTCSSHLYRHQKSHPELNATIQERCMIRDRPLERRFQCMCGKSYTCRSHLMRHQKTHQEQVFIDEDNDCDDSEADFEDTRQKPFVCECGKKFILSFSLLLHKKIHCRWKQSDSESGPPGH